MSERRTKGCCGVISKGKFPDVQRRSRGNEPYRADTPTRPHAVSFLPLALSAFLICFSVESRQASCSKRDGTIDRLSYSGDLPNHEGFI